jgi:DNA-binding FadR family transcriptional regulator
VKRLSISSTAAQAADEIADAVLSYSGPEQEWLLGSEAGLMEKLGLGRPGLRQAVRLLEQHELVVVRRGLNGGIYGRKPTSSGVTKAATLFLRFQKSTVGDMLNALVATATSCAASAATNPDEAERRRLERDYAELAEGKHAPDQFMKISSDFQRQVARLGGNPVMILFHDVLMDLSGFSQSVTEAYEDEERQHKTHAGHRRIARAIAEGDGVAAAGLMAEHLRWVIESMPPHVLARTLEPRR